MSPVFLILNVLHFLNDGVRTVFISLLPFIAISLNLTFTQVGFLSAMLGAILALFSLPAGFLGGKFGEFKVLFTALLLYSLGAIAVGFSINFYILAAAFALSGMGYAVYHAVGNILIAKASDNTNLGRNMSNFTAFGDIGRISLPMVALFLASLWGWRETFFIVAGCGLVVYAITQWWVPLKNHTVANKKERHNQSYKEWISELPFILKHKKLLLVMITGIIDNLASSPTFTFLPFLLLARGFSTETLAVFIAAFFIGSLTGKILIGRGIDAFGSAKMFIVAECMMAVTLILLSFSYNFYVLVGISMLLGAFTRGTGPIINVLFAEIAHEKHYAKVFGINETIVGIAITISPLIAGILADRFGVMTFFYIAAGLAIIATIPIWILLKSGPIRSMHLAPAEKID
jgi:predicted MFS family arabinose efflux permease